MTATTSGDPGHSGRTDSELASLFRREGACMVRLAYLLGADDTEDVAQEAFCRLLRAKSGPGPAQDRPPVTL